MKIEIENIKEVLVAGSYISDEDIKNAEALVKAGGVTFIDALLRNGVVNNDIVGQAIAESYKVPYSDLNSAAITPDQVRKIPEEAAKKLRVVLFTEDEKELTVTTDNPTTAGLEGEIEKIFPGKKIKITYSLAEDIESMFIHYEKPLDTRFSKIIEESERVAPEILEEIFDDAITYKASDIHFEPQAVTVLIRFRVDGVLHEAGRLPKEYYENVLNRIKVKSALRIDEHYAAQDGSLHYEHKGIAVDMRTSIIPIVEGEKVVLRVLGSYVQGLTFNDLGLTQQNQDLLREASEKPFGMILVVGPTGSGKTTTLYSLLKMLNTPDTNITTIEDPVEYKVQGLNQIQVNLATGLTFVRGLRSVVRQDPDIILVGEIRDLETAEISVNAALTGHLLLSTFHANDAATAVPRLLDMGIEPFLLSSTMNIIIAQRLVRKICDHCKHSVVKNPSDFDTPQLKGVAKYLPGKDITLYEGKKCEACGFTGYKGRTSIYEVIRVTPTLQELLVKRPSAQEIWIQARKEGAKSVFEDGIEKVKSGLTTIEELVRIAPPPDLILREDDVKDKVTTSKSVSKAVKKNKK
ncbi:Flp pilus assembly complex ATPase component TadA [Candidatus Gracilibacteria bacterium]|nr:Flp pilus assembly complex ATPase component TadA [Candidatus Gracilibacteria bacterium]MCF7898737.1 Flp pilus assembly complex ATPase component TadA [Candidatus Paceibacterota bacterium]